MNSTVFGVVFFDPQIGVAVKILKDQGLHLGLGGTAAADDEQHPRIRADGAQDQQNQKDDGAADRRHQIVAYAAADACDDGPEDVDRVPRVLDGGAEANNGQRAHHAQRQGDIVSDDSHDSSRHDCERHQGHVKLFRVEGTSVGEEIRQKNDKAQDGGKAHVAENLLPGGDRPGI